MSDSPTTGQVPPGHYRASDGNVYPVPPGQYLASDGRLYPLPASAPAPAPGAAGFAAAGPVSSAPVAAGWQWTPASGLLLGGAAVTVLGSVLPWATVDAGFESVDVSGTDADGVVTIVLALAALAFGIPGLLKRSKGLLITSLVATVLIVLVALVDIGDVSSVAEEVGFGVEATVGIGLWLVLIGGILAVVGAVMAVRNRTKM